MKRGNNYKQQHQEEVAYEQDSTGHKTPTPTVPDFREEIYAAEDARENEAAAETGSTQEQLVELKGQAKLWLSHKGFRKPQQELVLGMFMGRPTSGLVAATGRSKSWVYNELKRSNIKQAIADLNNGELAKSLKAQQATLSSEIKPAAVESQTIKVPILSRHTKKLREAVQGFPSFVNSNDSFIAKAVEELGCPSSMTNQEKRLAVVFQLFPRLLSDEGWKVAVVSDLEGLLMTAQYGSRREATKARKTLKFLTRFRKGNSLPFPSNLLTEELSHICDCLKALRHVWQVNQLRGVPLHERSEIVRYGIGDQDQNLEISDVTLQSLMGGDLLKAAAKVAEIATGVSSEVFERAAKNDVTFQEKLKSIQLRSC